MQEFNDFLEKHPFPKARLVDMLIQEYNSLNLEKEDLSRIIAASIIATQKIIDMRLNTYHKWLHSSSDKP